MNDKKKIEIFDKCFNKETIDLIDKLSDDQLANLCSNVSHIIENNTNTIKRQIKIMSHRHRK